MTDSPIRFRWVCGYMNCTYYAVQGDGAPYEVELRRGVCNYERSIYNGTESDWQREVIPAIGLLRNKYGSRPIPQAVVDAFNAWRASEHESWVEKWKAHPEKYGAYDPADTLAAVPVVARGAVYVVGTGWAINAPAATEGVSQ